MDFILTGMFLTIGYYIAPLVIVAVIVLLFFAVAAILKLWGFIRNTFRGRSV
jgi:uncharacterized membrane protein YccF (DUF307 family)